MMRDCQQTSAWAERHPQHVAASTQKFKLLSAVRDRSYASLGHRFRTLATLNQTRRRLISYFPVGAP